MSDIETVLHAGILAAQNGDYANAKAQLMQVIEKDERNEQAWFWLSHAVESVEDKQICLENTLAINPNHTDAQKELATLESALRLEKMGIVAEPIPREIQEKFDQIEPEFITQSSYEDIWEQDDLTLCPYCVYVLEETDESCPQCKHQLVHWRYTYEKPSPNLYVYFVFVLALAQLFGAQIIYDLLTVENLIWAEMLPRIILPAIVCGTSMLFALGVWMRQTWAFYGSLGMCCLLIFFFMVSLIAPINFQNLGFPTMDSSIENVVQGLGDVLGTAIRILQMGASIGVLGYGIFSVAPDFERVFKRETAVLNTRISESSSFYQQGKEYVKEGKWGAAVLHWQRATAMSPQNNLYQRQLGWGYAKLGFYQRSLDVLESALRQTAVPEKQQKTKQLIKQVNKMAQTNE